MNSIIKKVNCIILKGFHLFCFDFSGSGMSDGEYVTLGYYESNDTLDVI